ncbi:helix-turn-helix domain-containing protein [Desmospora activa]|uniref:Excisionase family DNA binding protein n=1 Tax=Desmospora activa DSM 45169 TaxID=1121389 RepID=A0A2T4YZ17_9BACL|nr:helix-turn-helix domain-containing protein [Desmospora activa]PTM52195.1 excisionase family DNA binding protein [Desmospora activa DSM 45169]
MNYYTPEEVAEKLKIKNTETIRRYLRRGKLRGAKLGKHWRISEKQLEEFFERQSEESQTIAGKN